MERGKRRSASAGPASSKPSLLKTLRSGVRTHPGEAHPSLLTSISALVDMQLSLTLTSSQTGDAYCDVIR